MAALGFQDATKQGRAMRIERERMLDTVDADGSDSVSLEEFTALMKGELTMLDPREDVTTIFTALSSIEGEKDPGVITISKLRAATQRFNLRISEEELQVMISEGNIHGRQNIGESDFLSLMSLSPWF